MFSEDVERKKWHETPIFPVSVGATALEIFYSNV